MLIRNICDNYYYDSCLLWCFQVLCNYYFWLLLSVVCMWWRNDAYLCACLSLLSPILSTVLSMLLYFWTAMVCVFLCFNLCSTFEYCYRDQRFINKLLLLLLLLLLLIIIIIIIIIMMIVDWFVILLEIYKLLNTIWLHRINCLFVSAYSNNHWHLIPVNSHSKLLISRFITLGNLCKIEHQISGISWNT